MPRSIFHAQRAGVENEIVFYAQRDPVEMSKLLGVGRTAAQLNTCPTEKSGGGGSHRSLFASTSLQMRRFNTSTLNKNMRKHRVEKNPIGIKT